MLTSRALLCVLLLVAVSHGVEPSAEDISAGVFFSIRASSRAVSGRIAEAELDAERSIAILDKLVAHDDRVLIRPLHTLVICQLQLGKDARAWQAYRRMRLIRAAQPADQELVH